MPRTNTWTSIFLAAHAAAALLSPLAEAGGIDHKVSTDNDGVISRSNQIYLEQATVIVLIGGSLWEGGESRIGNTYWRALDASVAGRFMAAPSWRAMAAYVAHAATVAKRRIRRFSLP